MIIHYALKRYEKKKKLISLQLVTDFMTKDLQRKRIQENSSIELKKKNPKSTSNNCTYRLKPEK